MIHINLANGELKCGEWIFSPVTKLSVLKDTLGPIEMEPWVSNQKWVSYRLNRNREFVCVVQFYDDILYLVDIYPKVSDDRYTGRLHVDRVEVLLLLKELGGENTYPWGSVSLFNDVKGGFKSAGVTYKQSVLEGVQNFNQ